MIPEDVMPAEAGNVLGISVHRFPKIHRRQTAVKRLAYKDCVPI
jgi:hypothetical protein